jgi:hypothetical protein
MYKVVVSLTTNPGRLLNIEPVIQHLLAQDYEIQQIEINLPDLYKNREEYVIPDFLKGDDIDFLENKSWRCLKYPKVKIFRTGKDIGPATKVIPTLIRYKDDKEVYIASFDDDHKYPRMMVSTLLRGLKLYGDKNVYTIGGIDLHVASKMTLEGFNPYITGKVTIIEGVFGVLYNPRMVMKDGEEDIVNYFEKVNKCKECLTSDDVTISNYLAWKGIDIVRLHFRHFNKLILYKLILFKKLIIKASEKDGNAIHLMPGGHKRRYFDACVFLKENGMLHLKIKRGCRNA